MDIACKCEAYIAS